MGFIFVFPNAFYKASSNQHQNQTKTPQKRKLQANIPDEHRCKNPQQDNRKQSSIKH